MELMKHPRSSTAAAVFAAEAARLAVEASTDKGLLAVETLELMPTEVGERLGRQLDLVDEVVGGASAKDVAVSKARMIDSFVVGWEKSWSRQEVIDNSSRRGGVASWLT